jgi:NAD(P)-dependent dehydrogenase (short-subunit alcohol dehydrogenase family)
LSGAVTGGATLLDQFNIAGQVVLLTGGGGEICGCIGERFAEIGAVVVLADVNRDAAEERAQAIRARGGRATAVYCDVLTAESIDACLREVEKSPGVPDILVNGAGGNQARGSAEVSFCEVEDLVDSGRRTFFDLEPEGLRQVLDLNLLGTMLPAQRIGARMVSRGSGSIVNISSMNAHTPLTRIPAYAAAKAAVSNFTQWLAVHLAHTGVRVNAVAPGFVMTEQLRFLHVDQATGEYTDRAKAVIAHTPMGRYAEPEEVAGAVLYLASRAARFVTGTVIPVDGGFSSYSI